MPEPEYVTSAGRSYALLDWGTELEKPGVGKKYGDDPEDYDDEEAPSLFA